MISELGPSLSTDFLVQTYSIVLIVSVKESKCGMWKNLDSSPGISGSRAQKALARDLAGTGPVV